MEETNEKTVESIPQGKADEKKELNEIITKGVFRGILMVLGLLLLIWGLWRTITIMLK